MTSIHFILLLSTGLIGGFLGGLLGLGGGVVFAPVLLFYFQQIGVPDAALLPLTIGTSLCAVLITMFSTTYAQHRKGALRIQVALFSGTVSASIALIATIAISTQSWYDKRYFQLFFGAMLLLVTWRMVMYKPIVGGADVERTDQKSILMAIGGISGFVSALTGVGGGTILVPAYHRFLNMQMTVATATSSGTILMTSATAILGYLYQGWGKHILPFSFGYVDGLAAVLLAFPAILSAQWGVGAAHKINTLWLKRIFAAFSLFISLRMIYNALFDL